MCNMSGVVKTIIPVIIYLPPWSWFTSIPTSILKTISLQFCIFSPVTNLIIKSVPAAEDSPKKERRQQELKCLCGAPETLWTGLVCEDY